MAGAGGVAKGHEPRGTGPGVADSRTQGGAGRHGRLDRAGHPTGSDPGGPRVGMGGSGLERRGSRSPGPIGLSRLRLRNGK